jgi:FAD/FMN-containing dehydrogenase
MTANLPPALAGLDVETRPAQVRRRSRDFYWYSPVLKRRLDHVTADMVITPRNEAEIARVLAHAFATDTPVTVRGAGTGNYGQAMPLARGIVLDLSAMNGIVSVTGSVGRFQAGAVLRDIDQALSPKGLELRFHPSTHGLATIGGFVAGGSGGVGSVTWGTLRDRGAVHALKLMTMEAEPRTLELRGLDVHKAMHCFGTCGVITEVELPLAPAYDWVELIVATDDFMAAARLGDLIAHEDALTKKLVTAIASPVPGQYLFPGLVSEGQSVLLLMVADFAAPITRQLILAAGGRIVHDLPAAEARVPLYEYAWNHTTLQSLKHDRTLTYLQVAYPPPTHLERVEQMWRTFGDEVPAHVEFVRMRGVTACSGLPLVRFTSEERLFEIIRYHQEQGCPIFNPHVFTLEEMGRKDVDAAQLAFKHAVDPKNLLNPGKMLSFDDPAKMTRVKGFFTFSG